MLFNKTGQSESVASNRCMYENWLEGTTSSIFAEVSYCPHQSPALTQRHTYRVLQTIQMKLTLLCVWAELAVLGSTKTALKFKYET